MILDREPIKRILPYLLIAGAFIAADGFAENSPTRMSGYGIEAKAICSFSSDTALPSLTEDKTILQSAARAANGRGLVFAIANINALPPTTAEASSMRAGLTEITSGVYTASAGFYEGSGDAAKPGKTIETTLICPSHPFADALNWVKQKFT